MHNDLLSELLADIQQDYADSGIVNSLKSYAEFAQNRSDSRNTQATDASKYPQLISSVEKLKHGRVSRYGSVRRRHLAQLGLLENTGIDLTNRILTALPHNVSLQAAGTSIWSIHTEVLNARNDVNDAIKSLKSLGIAHKTEIFVVEQHKIMLRTNILPDQPENEPTIDSVNSKLHDWDVHLQMVQELALGKRSSRLVSRIFSGSLEITISFESIHEAAIYSIMIAGYMKYRLKQLRFKQANEIISQDDDIYDSDILTMPTHAKTKFKELIQEEIETYLENNNLNATRENIIAKTIDMLFKKLDSGEKAEVVSNLRSTTTSDLSDQETELTSETLIDQKTEIVGNLAHKISAAEQDAWLKSVAGKEVDKLPPNTDQTE